MSKRGAVVDHAAAAARFVADAPRARWHDETLWWVRRKRDRAAAAVPEWEELRGLAARVKAHTLARLGEYLEQFERHALAAGARVHWARDGAEHNAIVHGLLVARGVTRLVKSKSMLTEECGLNPYLQARGIEVTDTDLGERIVQLAGEPPSHIVLPAIHRRKEEIGDLFHEQLGTERGLSDPALLTEAARVHLRAKFLAAQAGLTGVNFAVAETGGIVVCTNEGNADMGASLPPLHVACMGIEKVVPRVQDLAVFLRLLARSATGQPLTTYTSHFHGPASGGELHIVIVDNGRSRILQDAARGRALACIRCGACLNTCPVFRRSGGHSYGHAIPGPIGSVLAPARDPRRYASLPFASTLCGACDDVCPVKIDLHDALLSWRAVLHRDGHVPLRERAALRLAGLALARPALYRLAGVVVRFFGRRLPRFVVYSRLNTWGRRRELPPMPAASFHEQYRGRRG